MQTVSDFVTNPISGLSEIDNRVIPLPEYMVTGVAPPVAQLAFVPTIASVTDIYNPVGFLWRRPKTLGNR